MDRQHGVHAHDIVHMSMISDNTHLQLELRGAAAGFLGFEHAPTNDAEIHAVAELKDQLQAIDTLFEINHEADCSLDEVMISLPGLEDSHGHQDHHEDHDSHEHHDEAAHDEAAHDGSHADVQAQYDFTCSSIEALSSMTVYLFDLFPAFETAEVVYLLADQQSAQTLRPGRSVLRLR